MIISNATPIINFGKQGKLEIIKQCFEKIIIPKGVYEEIIIKEDNVESLALKRAIDETDRRRTIQEAHNKKHHITPTTISKEITSIVEQELSESVGLDKIENQLAKSNITSLIKEKERQMKLAAQELQFELAAILRDEVIKLKKMQKERQDLISSA